MPVNMKKLRRKLKRLHEVRGNGWSIVQFGKHKGKSLPQILFHDPDWFFWFYEQGNFDGVLQVEAQELVVKAKNIKIPKAHGKDTVAEYVIHPHTNNFAAFNLVPRTQPAHVGASITFRLPVIDLSVPREYAPYDKFGYRLFLKQLKHYLFGNSSRRMTRKRCEEFFDDDGHFEPVKIKNKKRRLK